MAIMAKKIQPAKTEAIEATKESFKDYNDFIFTEYRGLTVEQITSLRKKLYESQSVRVILKLSHLHPYRQAKSFQAFHDFCG